MIVSECTKEVCLQKNIDNENMELEMQNFEHMFDYENLPNSMFVTELEFYDKELGHRRRLLCISETVYLMNDSGKTIDKY